MSTLLSASQRLLQRYIKKELKKLLDIERNVNKTIFWLLGLIIFESLNLLDIKTIPNFKNRG